MISVAFSIVVLSCCYQGRFKLRKKKPEQEEAKVTYNQAYQSGSNDKESKASKEQEEDLPDLKDPEVQKVTSLIQVLNYSSTNMESKATSVKENVGLIKCGVFHSIIWKFELNYTFYKAIW